MRDVAGSLLEQATDQRRNTTGGPMCKSLPDLVRYRGILRDHPPDLLVETGTWTGASAQWFRKSGAARVVTIDRQAVELDFPGVTFLHGDSADADLAAEVWRLASVARSVMVVLDSDHSAAHVAAELELYAPLVTRGSYLVVEDTILHYMQGHPWAGTPWDAREAWARSSSSCDFETDTELEDLLPTTQHPGGWIRRWR